MEHIYPTSETGWARTMAWSVVLLRAFALVGAALAALDYEGEAQLRLLLATTLFAMCVLLIGTFGGRHAAIAEFTAYWIDIGWALVLFKLSGGATLYYLLLYIPVLLAGLRGAARLTIALSIAGAAATFALQLQHGTGNNWLHLFLRPMILLLFGTLATAAARAGARPREVAAFALDLIGRIDSRSGLLASASTLVEDIGVRFKADAALLAIRSHEGCVRVFWWELGERLSELPQAATSIASTMFVIGDSRTVPAVRVANSGADAPGPALAELIERDQLMIAAAGCDEASAARLLLGRNGDPFRNNTLRSVHHVLTRAFPLLENAGLLEQLAAEAAEIERARISRDLHDSAVQPYIGLKLAIEALARRISPKDPIAPDVHRLLMMTQQELASMRGVIKEMRTPIADNVPLDEAIHSQARRFAELFNFHVDVAVDCKTPIDRSLSAELVHMISEALSNVRRHTRSRSASIKLSSEVNMLVLAVRNAIAADDQPPTPFTPRSLAERAATLGGYTSVQTEASGTVVTIRVPLG